MENNINILDKNECTGCKVCYQVCPHDAITIIENKEGLKHPVIDDNKCTNCGICVKKCHALNDNFETEFEQQIYDVRASDDIRMKSSSGGMFTLVANYVLENNGYVCGASFTNDWLGVEHIIINDKKYLDKLRGSKYIESDLGNCFSEIKKLLNENNLVLFTGCPCQVSALKSYLNKDYNNLITIDVICDSIISNKIWIKYLKEQFTEEEIKNIEYISFINKEKINWERILYIKLYNKEYFDKFYIELYYKHFIIKYECHHCKYRRYERVSDISIGDHWSTSNYDNKGVSLVVINTEKGNSIFNKIKNNCEYINITNENPYNGALSGSITIFTDRKYFFGNLDKKSFKELYSDSVKKNIAIANMIFQNNCGGVLTYYALCKVLENLSYNPILICKDILSLNGNNTNGHKIALKYLNVVDKCNSKEKLRELNKQCNIFMVGSDVVWSYPQFYNYNFYYILDFAYKNKIAYSSSFYLKSFYLDSKNKMFIKHYLNRFNAISVRENTGLNILKKEFNIDGEHVLDPVFLLDNYDMFINNSKLDIKNKYITVHTYGNHDNIQIYLKKLSDKLSLPIEYINLYSDYDEDNSTTIEDYLYLIKNSELIITDSFHTTCFSMIFNKNFISIRRFEDDSRVSSLLETFDLTNKLITENEINKIYDDEKLLEKIDFNSINKKIIIKKEKSLNWLKKSLEQAEKNSSYNNYDEIIDFLIEENIKNEYENNKLKNDIDVLKNDTYVKFNKLINLIAWWIPVKKWRDNFRAKFAIADQTRPE